MADRTVVVRGPLGEVGLVALLRSVGLSRHRMAIEVFDPGGRVGAIFVKAGRVVGVEPPSSDPLGWVRELIASSADRSFTVSRLTDAAPLSEALGSVETLIARAIGPASRP